MGIYTLLFVRLRLHLCLVFDQLAMNNEMVFLEPLFWWWWRGAGWEWGSGEMIVGGSGGMKVAVHSGVRNGDWVVREH